MGKKKQKSVSEEIFSGMVFPLFAVIMILWLICYICYPPKPWEPIEPKSPWKNIDPNRPVTDIAEYDYETQTVKYREENPNKGKDTPRLRPNKSSGIILSSGNVEIHTGLSAEEIIEQIADEIDYHEIYDYYGEELR